MNDSIKDSDLSVTTGARDELRLRLLRALEANPELSQRQLAVKLGVSLGGVNYALQALVERGLVKVSNFRRSGSKVSYLYLLTPRGVAKKSSLAAAFLAQKLVEYELLREELETLKCEVDSSRSKT